MNKNIIVLASFLLSSLTGHAGPVFKDILVLNKIIWALTNEGRLRLYDGMSGKRIDKGISADQDIILISKDKDDNPIIANKRKQVKKYNGHTKTWEVVAQYNAEPLWIFTNSGGAYFAVTEMGIQDLATKKFFLSKKSLNDQITYRSNWGKPYCSYIDKNDIIWLGFGYGEWGGNLIAFHSVKRQFLNVYPGDFRVELYPIKSFFEDAVSVYVSAGLQHMTTDGIILRVDTLKTSIVLNSRSGWSKKLQKDSSRLMVEGEYIGPATYSSFNKSLYFYSQNGIFKGEKSKDLSKIENWEKIVSPKLSWKYGQPDAVGSPMNVVKLCIIDGTRFVFLSQNDGIGFFDGKEIIML